MGEIGVLCHNSGVTDDIRNRVKAKLDSINNKFAGKKQPGKPAEGKATEQPSQSSQPSEGNGANSQPVGGKQPEQAGVGKLTEQKPQQPKTDSTGAKVLLKEAIGQKWINRIKPDIKRPDLGPL